MKIADISIKRPSLVIIIFAALTIFGFISYNMLSYELLPKFTPGVVSISTVYPGASPSEVENTVTKKIEEAVASMEKVKKIDATSFESLSLVIITLTDDADVDYAMNDAQRKINSIIGDMPESMKTPSLNKFSFDDMPILTISATSNLDGQAFYDLMDKRIQPQLSRIDGVARVTMIGGQEREIQVNIDANKLEAYNLSILQVQQTILASNMDFPTGNLKSEDKNILLRLAGKYKDVEELRNLVIIQGQELGQVRLKDIAEVIDTQEDAEKIARVDFKPSIAVQIMKQSDANAVEISKRAQAELDKIMQEYKHYDLKLEVVNDSSTYTLNSANAVLFDLILAIVLVAVIMLLFLHSLRNAMIVMIAIPVSLIATFIGMFFMGFSLNLMSLLALSLVVGIVVDDAIVVIENIYRHMEMGKNRVRASIDGTKEIGFTVISITSVIVVVFLPIALSQGMVSNILREFCMTIVIAVVLSLVTSFSIIPLLTSRYGQLEHLTGKSLFQKLILGFENFLHKFTKWVGNILKWSLNHKAITVVGVFALLIASFGLVIGGYISFQFVPQGDKGEFLVQVELPKGASLEETNQMIMKAENYIGSKPEVVRQITTVGQSSDGMAGIFATVYKGEISVTLVDKKYREDNTAIYAAKLKKELDRELVGAKVVTAPIGMMGAERSPLELIIIGPDVDMVLDYGEKVKEILKNIPGAAEVKISAEKGNPEITIDIDRDKMSALGLNLQTVGGTLQTSFNGNTDGKFRQGEYEYDINIRFDNMNRQKIEDVKNVTFVNNMGQLIRLEQFASVEEKSGPSQLQRRDKSAAVKVQSQAIGVSVDAISKQLEAEMAKLDTPTGITYVWGGDKENQTDGMGSLGIALIVAVLLVYVIMVMLYDSFVYPFVVLMSIPLCIIGAFLALALTNNSLNIFTMLGLIMLIGLVAKNAIILVDFTNQMKEEEGKSTFEALMLANKARLRPILMTTIAMVIGMLPIAMASGAGAEWKNGLAWVIIGGLISSLFLTLVFVPVIYMMFDNFLDRFGMNKPKLPFDQLMVEEYEHKEVKEY